MKNMPAEKTVEIEEAALSDGLVFLRKLKAEWDMRKNQFERSPKHYDKLTETIAVFTATLDESWYSSVETK